MKSLYRRFVSWLARDIIESERKSAFENGVLLEKGRVLLEAQQDAVAEALVKEFPRLMVVRDRQGNPMIMVNPNVSPYDPLGYFKGETQLATALDQGWENAILTGVKPMEY
jgi:hypothetical protein